MCCECRGRKKAALTYVVTYTIGCATKHWNIFVVLLVGRLFCGVATSLLYSAFESWLVAEHFKVRSWPAALFKAHPGPRAAASQALHRQSPVAESAIFGLCCKLLEEQDY